MSRRRGCFGISYLTFLGKKVEKSVETDHISNQKSDFSNIYIFLNFILRFCSYYYYLLLFFFKGLGDVWLVDSKQGFWTVIAILGGNDQDILGFGLMWHDD